ncbi:hypothetical protein AB3480_32235 [Rhizobium mongolense]|uniref:hypothetical protein n=1 Tax=Rhizobium mongolense TaxID=57676 RepID=UPI0034A1FADC
MITLLNDDPWALWMVIAQPSVSFSRSPGPMKSELPSSSASWHFPSTIRGTPSEPLKNPALCGWPVLGSIAGFVIEERRLPVVVLHPHQSGSEVEANVLDRFLVDHVRPLDLPAEFTRAGGAVVRLL